MNKPSPRRDKLSREEIEAVLALSTGQNAGNWNLLEAYFERQFRDSQEQLMTMRPGGAYETLAHVQGKCQTWKTALEIRSSARKAIENG